MARKPGTETVVIEVEGESSRQKEQAVYSAFGQIVLLMRPDTNVRYGIAVPDTPSWEGQNGKDSGAYPRYAITDALAGRRNKRSRIEIAASERREI